jgi:triphosphoribosyl-dephospho-CoA synthase
MIEPAFLWACTLDVVVAKPGNVSEASPGHGMTAAMFIASARAAAGPLCRRGTPVGRRIEAAVQASWAAAQCNTNLGIVLLCAPLAAARERCGAAVPSLGGLRAALRQVLDELDVGDARAAYRGIAQANPGGLGRADKQDVASEPDISLREAMALAAQRDSIARQYATGFGDVFERGLPVFLQALQAAAPEAMALAPAAAAQARRQALERAVLGTFLSWLAGQPDSHIVRKHGTSLAQSVTAQAAALHADWLAEGAPARSPALSSWDTQLKTHRINPGTSADLTVATAFVAACLDPSLWTRPVAGAAVA